MTDEPSIPLAQPPRLTEAEQTVLRELTRREAAAVAPKMAAAYSRLLELSRSDHPVDHVLAAHLAREILSALPGALGNDVTRERLDYEPRLQALCLEWPRDARDGGPPAKALDALRKLLDDHETAHQRARSGPLALLTQADRARAGFIPDPSIDRWRELSSRGSGLAHRIRNRDRPLPAAEETRRLVDEVTAILVSGVAPYFEGLREVDRLVALDKPTEADARRLAGLLSTQSQYAYFFERAGEGWLLPLAGLGRLLSTPPRLVDVGGGYVQAPGWPQGVFLERVANVDPQLVARLAQRALLTDNPRAIAQVVRIAQALPPESALGLVASVSKAIRAPLAVEYAAIEVASLAQSLAKAGFPAESGDLLISIVRAAMESRRRDSWHLDKVLGEPLEVVVRAGGDVIPALRSCLRRLSRASRPIQRHSTSWVHNIDVRPGHGVDAIWLLANGIYRSLLEAPLPSARTQVVELLADRYRVFARIALAAIAERPELLESADTLLLHPLDWDDGESTRYEFRRALAVLWRRSTPGAHGALLAYAAAAKEAEVVIARWAKQGIDRDPDEVRRQWRSWLLYKIAEHLPPDWLESYGPLAVHEDDRLPEPTAEWVTAKSPFSEDELNALDAAAVLERARCWQPGESSMLDGASREGLGRVLGAVMLFRLSEFVPLGSEFGRIPVSLLSYVTGVLGRGLREDHAENRGQGVALILAMGETFLARGEDEPDSRDVKRELAATIAFAANGDLLDEAQMHAALQMVRTLHGDSDPSVDSETRDAANGYDVGMLALNSVRGEATTAGIELLLAARRAGHAALFDEASRLLRMSISSDASLSVRAAVGMRLPWLLGRDAAHQSEWLEILFGDDVPAPARAATWSAYVLYAQFFRDIALLLAAQYQSAVTTLEARPEEERGRPRDDDEHLGIHVAMAHILALAPESEQAWLEEFYTRAAGWVRARVTRWIAEQAANADVAIEVRQRARAFLADRVRKADGESDSDELKAISWISPTPDNEREVLETILLPALEKTAGTTEDEPGAAAFAGRVAGHMPREAGRMVQLLVAGDQWHSLPHLAAAEVRSALAVIMASGDPDARAIGSDVVNTLGAQGFLEFRDLLAPSA
jgi:hypothetical protein